MAVSEVYAAALFELSGDDEAVAAQLRELDGLFRREPAYPRLIDAPVLPAAARRELLREAFGDTLAPVLLRFCFALADHGRFALFGEIAAAYAALRNRAAGVCEVTAQTAAPLPPELTDRLRRALEARSGRQVRLTVEVVPSLLGGVRLLGGGHVLDATLRGRLEELGRSLRANQ